MATIKELRNKLGISQEELAKRAGVGEATIMRMENGQKNTHKSIIKLVAMTLGADPESIDLVKK
jgi:transcriptional regulator with XRE-family HTH domain